MTSFESLRERHYNAQVVAARAVHDELLILRVQPDTPLTYRPGQYTTLGLGAWEPRVDAESLAVNDAGPSPKARSQLIRRAYSISCPVLDDEGRLVTCGELSFLEFYITLVRHPSDDPPMLSPRLFTLKPGQRLHVGPRAHGSYTLDPVGEADDVLFVATGTGEAPHNAMIAELLARGHPGRIGSLVCVRSRRDLGYLAVHQELERRYDTYRAIPLTTREPENIDPARPDYVGKRYVQDLLASGRLEEELGWPLDPDRTHVFLCGSPDMIGLPHKTPTGEEHFPEPAGMVELLTQRGFQIDQPHRPGRVHFEKYW